MPSFVTSFPDILAWYYEYGSLTGEYRNNNEKLCIQSCNLPASNALSCFFLGVVLAGTCFLLSSFCTGLGGSRSTFTGGG